MKHLAEKIAAVRQAEAACEQQREQADQAWRHVKSELRRTATPGRIVVSGLALGFASGFTTSGAAGAANSKLLTGPIFSMLLETVVPGLLAGLTAAVTANTGDAEGEEGEEGEQADVEAEAAEDAAQDPPAEEPVAPKPRRRKRRVDAAT